MNAPPTITPTEEVRADAMAELEDARVHLMSAMRMLDSDSDLVREYLHCGATVLSLDDLRTMIARGKRCGGVRVLADAKGELTIACPGCLDCETDAGR